MVSCIGGQPTLFARHDGQQLIQRLTFLVSFFADDADANIDALIADECIRPGNQFSDFTLVLAAKTAMQTSVPHRHLSPPLY